MTRLEELLYRARHQTEGAMVGDKWVHRQVMVYSDEDWAELVEACLSVVKAVTEIPLEAKENPDLT